MTPAGLAERNGNGEIIAVWAGIVGRDCIKRDTYYRLIGGEPIEAPEGAD
jgi:hypothetical protein